MTKSNKNKMKEDHKNKYNDLAPINTLSQDDTYIQALNWAFMNPSIKNIALTGAYGSGKSSILLSFLEQYENIRKKTLSISLALLINYRRIKIIILLKIRLSSLILMKLKKVF